jgi:DNA mismatch repair protein MutL
MGHIRELPSDLINRIAAGEVVERPSSVIKELVENSIDAGARQVEVELKDGGKSLIVVSDNGKGMDRDDALLAVKRHATSKIKSDEDLFALTSMGFRGEALAAISSVSKFVLHTRRAQDPLGYKVNVYSDQGPLAVEASRDPGTTIVVENLFHNVPARLKFLKSDATELSTIQDMFEDLCLAHRDVSFKLRHNDKELVSVSEQKTRESSQEEVLRRRVSEVFKRDKNLDSLLYVESECAYGKFFGLISPPGIEKPTAASMRVFVNDRPVKDKGIRAAILRGYHSHLLRGRYPFAVIFLSVDPGLVDVNVHPAKAEVRLQFASDLQAMIATAIRGKLREGEWAAPSVQGTASQVFGELSFSDQSPKKSDWSFGAASSLRASEPVLRTTEPKSQHLAPSSGLSGFEHRMHPNTQNNAREASFKQKDFGVEKLRHSIDDQDAHVSELDKLVPWDKLVFVGSLFDCYLMFQTLEGDRAARVLVVDQHAFHERILYERLLKSTHWILKQRLLVPDLLTFDRQTLLAIQARYPNLKSVGFEFEFLDEGSLEVLSIPQILSKSDLEKVLLDIVKNTTEGHRVEIEHLSHDIAASMACHGAVRAGEALPMNELQTLLQEALTVDFYANCPHGRRVLRYFSEAEVGSWFDR